MEAARTEQFRFDVGFRLALLLDPDGTVRAVSEVSGLGDTQPSAFLGRTIVEIAAQRGSGPEGAAVWTQRLQAARQATGTEHYADRPPDTSPSTPPSIDSSLTPIRRTDGSLDSILFVVEDRTAFFSTQRRLHDSEQRFRTLAESLPQMVWTADANGDVDYFAPRWAQFTGRSPEELLGTGFRDLIHPDDVELLASARAASNWREPVIFRLLRHDGEYRTMEAFVEPVHDQDGQLIRFVGGTTDITERRLAEDRSRELQEQLRSALAMTGLGRFTVELRPPSLTGDARVSDIMGMQAADLVADADAERLFDQIHPDDKPRIRAAFAASLGNGPDFDEEYRILRPTAGGTEERWVAVAGRVEFDEEGPHRMFGVIEDITDRRREIEARLRMQKREAIGTLAGGIAHDFNNVIGAIMSNAVLAETELDVGASPRESVKEIRRGAVRAADLVRRMLAFSRETPPTRIEVDLEEVTREACSLLRPTLAPNVQVEISAQPGPSVTLGDATQLHQVVMNLVTNAGQVLGRAGGTIDVTIDRIEIDPAAEAGAGPTGTCLRLQVRDNGPGMPDEVLRRAFDPFFTTKPPGEGTGLGLAATQTVVHNHGGTVQIDSSVGTHTTVTVVLPATQPTDDFRPTGDPTASPALRRDGQPPRVMFVDDEQALATLAERAMPTYGCHATVFTDPGEALGAFTQQPEHFDALVTDLSMPGLSGLQLSAEVRALRPGLPVILTSGFLTPANEDEARRQGVDAIIAKPCSIDDLTAAVLRLVD